MKLSEKGRDRLYGSHNVFYDDDIEGDVVALYELSEVWEFEPDDFEDCVVLTVEEAKAICGAMNPSLSDRKWRDLLYQRITGYMPIHSTPMEGKLILPNQAEGKE